MQAVVVCAARWGIDKTTVDDLAREAGLSRATVYRLFPGGKDTILQRAIRTEVDAALGELRTLLESAESLEGSVSVLLSAGSRLLVEHPALAYMRANDPAKVRAFLSFERLDLLFRAAAVVLAPSLERFLSPEAARETVVWLARLVVSHYVTPDAEQPLTDPEVARHLACTYVLPGIAVAMRAPKMPGRPSLDTISMS
jgi:AcrR family transcriptional regulator